jgi:hypothetical protein
MDNSEKINKIKDLTAMCFHLGFTTMLGFIQDIIFGIDNVGLNDDRMITIPSHLNAFKYLSISNANFQSPDKEINLGLKKYKSSVKQDQNYYSNNIEEREDEDEDEDMRSQSSDALKSKNNAQGKNEKVGGSNRNSSDNYTDKESQNVSPKKDLIIAPKMSPEKVSNIKKGEINISFQQNSNDPDSQLGKQFTLEEIGKSKKDVNIINENANQYLELKTNIKKSSFLNKFDNSINIKLKNLKIDNNDDKLEDLINSLSQGGNSRLSDDDDDDSHIPKPKENTKNMFNEINEKQNHNFNSRIFLKK